MRKATEDDNKECCIKLIPERSNKACEVKEAPFGHERPWDYNGKLPYEAQIWARSFFGRPAVTCTYQPLFSMPLMLSNRKAKADTG